MGDWVRNLPGEPPKAANHNAVGDARLERRSAVSQAINLRREVERFEARWPKPTPGETEISGITWAQLERQLADLADSPIKSDMARDLVSATRKMARFKPPEMVLREILCLASTILDESFQPDLELNSREGPADMP